MFVAGKQEEKKRKRDRKGKKKKEKRKEKERREGENGPVRHFWEGKNSNSQQQQHRSTVADYLIARQSI
jgi:hypothetical protein